MKEKMYKEQAGVKRFFIILLFATGAMLLLGGIVLLLWNAILTSLLHVNTITYWQAVGLLVLCKILFGSFRPGSRRTFLGSPGHLKEKLMNMSEEEKTVFREQWQKRCAERKK